MVLCPDPAAVRSAAILLPLIRPFVSYASKQTEPYSLLRPLSPEFEVQQQFQFSTQELAEEEVAVHDHAMVELQMSFETSAGRRLFSTVAVGELVDQVAKVADERPRLEEEVGEVREVEVMIHQQKRLRSW